MSETKIKTEPKIFSITRGKGFQITFPSGITLSTQFGWGNYCENGDKLGAVDMNKNDWQSNDAEIAIIGPKGWLTREFKPEHSDDVIGRVNFAEWLEAFDWCRNWKAEAK